MVNIECFIRSNCFDTITGNCFGLPVAIDDEVFIVLSYRLLTTCIDLHYPVGIRKELKEKSKRILQEKGLKTISTLHKDSSPKINYIYSLLPTKSIKVQCDRWVIKVSNLPVADYVEPLNSKRLGDSAVMENDHPIVKFGLYISPSAIDPVAMEILSGVPHDNKKYFPLHVRNLKPLPLPNLLIHHPFSSSDVLIYNAMLGYYKKVPPPDAKNCTLSSSPDLLSDADFKNFYNLIFLQRFFEKNHIQ